MLHFQHHSRHSRSWQYGVCYIDALLSMIHQLCQDEFEARGSFAGIPTQIANKISYHLDLVGPSIPLDTACSSTLSAMHLAVQSIRAGDCEAALIGGCQLNHRFVELALPLLSKIQSIHQISGFCTIYPRRCIGSRWEVQAF